MHCSTKVFRLPKSFLAYAYKLCIIKKSSLRPIASISSTALIYFPCIFDSCICGQFDPSLNTDLAEQKESYFIYFIFHIIGIILNKYKKGNKNMSNTKLFVAIFCENWLPTIHV